jgi:two-component system sensor histidine kinase BaeS
MTRRLTLVILGTVAATLIVAGLGTLGLARFGARQRTEDDLRGQATEIASTIQNLDDQGAVRVLGALRRSLHLEGVAVLRFGPGGRTIDAPPDGVTLNDLDLKKLRDGKTEVGSHGSLAFAAAPASVSVTTRSQATDNVLAVVVVTRQTDTLLRPAIGWFVLASIITLAVGGIVAWQFGRRLTRPVRDADAAARRIAAGDLSARVPVPSTRPGDELAALAGSVNAMAEALQRSQGLEQQFLLSVSHDLRTPLTSIRGYAEAIADGALPDAAEGGAVILSEARRLERLVGDLLDLAKLETRAFSLSIEAVDLVDIAVGTVDGFRPEADEAGVRLEVDAVEAAIVNGDPDRLAQVAGNLVQNALKFASSRIDVRIAIEDGTARLDIVDDGPGIAPDDLAHVFERLYVARHEPRRKEVGSGLGLAIVRELVTAMGGTVAADAAPGGGACLTVRLPLSSRSAVAP